MPTADLRTTAAKIIHDSWHFWPFRALLATIFSLGKIGQTAGLNVIGINALFAKYPTHNPRLEMAITLLCTSADILTTSGTRVPKIYTYFLNSKLSLANIYLTDQYPLPRGVNLANGYLLSCRDTRLHKIAKPPQTEDQEIHLTAANRQLLSAVHQALNEPFQLATDTEVCPDEQQPYRLINNDLSEQQRVLLRELTQTAFNPSYDTVAASIAYHFCYTLCQLSVATSFVYAYLSGINLANFYYPKLDNTGQYSIGTFVALAATLSYALFNLPKMREGVNAFAKSLDSGLSQGDFGIPQKALALTLLTTVAGTIANFGLSYLLMQQSLEALPFTQAWPTPVKTAIIFSSAIISLCASIFSFAYSSYELIKQSLQADQPRTGTNYQCSYPSYVIAVVLTDSFGATAGGFIGMLLLNDSYLNATQNKNTEIGLLAFSLFCFTNNILMYFSLAMVNSMPAINAINGFTTYLSQFCTLNGLRSRAPALPTSDASMSTEQHGSAPSLLMQPLSSQGNHYRQITTADMPEMPRDIELTANTRL